VFQTALAGGVSNISFSSLSADLGRTMYRYSFRIPPYYTLLVRSLSVLEGIALASDPNYKVGFRVLSVRVIGKVEVWQWCSCKGRQHWQVTQTAICTTWV
jgi:hypothetical protein